MPPVPQRKVQPALVPYYKSECGRVVVYKGDNREVLPILIGTDINAIVTDPPYGVGKAEWDMTFPTEWYHIARNIAETIYIMVGQTTIPICVKTVGDDYRDTMAVWLSNGMTLGPLGFGNWIPVIVAQKCRRFLGGQNAFRVVVNTSEKIDHPSPKPFDAMLKLVANRDHQTILDPFMGSGTTGVACVKLGRKFIGIEIDEKYCDIAIGRLRYELVQCGYAKAAAPPVVKVLKVGGKK